MTDKCRQDHSFYQRYQRLLLLFLNLVVVFLVLAFMFIAYFLVLLSLYFLFKFVFVFLSLYLRFESIFIFVALCFRLSHVMKKPKGFYFNEILKIQKYSLLLFLMLLYLYPKQCNGLIHTVSCYVGNPQRVLYKYAQTQKREI